MSNADWDERNYQLELESAVEYYCGMLCGDRLPDTQLTEVRHAFLSGVHWLNLQEDYCPDAMLEAVLPLLMRERLKQPAKDEP